jgi:hypothetical protein
MTVSFEGHLIGHWVMGSKWFFLSEVANDGYFEKLPISPRLFNPQIRQKAQERFTASR